MNTSGITTIACDYGGVLAQSIDKTYMCHMAEEAGADQEEFFASLWKYRHDYDLGALDAAAYWQMVCEGAGGRWPKESSSQQELIEVLMHLDTIAWAIVNPGMLRWLVTLRREGYRRIIISNMAVETFDMLVKDHVLMHYFEHAVVSGRIRINKPDREIFEEASRRADAEMDQILFIDDLPRNVEGAREAGMHALQFTGTGDLEKALREQFPDIPRQGLNCH